MKHFIKLTLILILLAKGAAAQTIEKNYSLELTSPDQPVVLDISLYYGSATVIGYEGKTVEITAKLQPLTDAQKKNQKRWGHNNRQHYQGNGKTKKPMRSTEGLKPVQNVAFNLEIEEHNNVVEIDSGPSNHTLNLLVKVPNTASMELEIYDGEKVEISNILGSVEVETWRGEIIANNISGPVVAETHNSDIVVDFSAYNDQSPSSFTSHNGDIDLTFESSAVATIQIQNYQGEVLSGLDVAFEPIDKLNEDKRGNKKKIKIGAQLEGKLNGGGQQITLNTYGGNVYLRKK